MNSVLNPEAPEFYPHLTSVTQVCYVDLVRFPLSIFSMCFYRNM